MKIVLCFLMVHSLCIYDFHLILRLWSRAMRLSFMPTFSLPLSAMMHALWVAYGLFSPLYHFRKIYLFIICYPANSKGGWEEGWKGTRVFLCGVHLTHSRLISRSLIGNMCLILLKSKQRFCIMHAYSKSLKRNQPRHLCVLLRFTCHCAYTHYKGHIPHPFMILCHLYVRRPIPMWKSTFETQYGWCVCLVFLLKTNYFLFFPSQA